MFDPAAPLAPLPWLLLLGTLAAVGLAMWFSDARYVGVDLSTREVAISGRALFGGVYTHRFELDQFSAVRSFVFRKNRKEVHYKVLELISGDGQSGLVLLRGQTETVANLARLGAELAWRAGLEDLGFVGETRKMERQVLPKRSLTS